MTVTIREGGYYVTRSGRKVGPITRVTRDTRSAETFPWTCNLMTWRGDGTHCGRPECPQDLVAEWVDIPTSQPDPGQIWRYHGETGEFYTHGFLYAVLETHHGLIFMTDDDGPRSADWMGHPWTPNRFFAAFQRAPETTKADVKAEIADEAKRIVTGARRSAYGTPEQNFERIARFWQAYFDNRGLVLRDANGAPHQITAADVSPMMRLMKEARLCETPDHRDSFVDLVGYALTGAEVNGVAPLDKAPDLS